MYDLKAYAESLGFTDVEIWNQGGGVILVIRMSGDSARSRLNLELDLGDLTGIYTSAVGFDTPRSVLSMTEAKTLIETFRKQFP
jgi:hypothetical protein